MDDDHDPQGTPVVRHGIFTALQQVRDVKLMDVRAQWGRQRAHDSSLRYVHAPSRKDPYSPLGFQNTLVKLTGSVAEVFRKNRAGEVRQDWW
jgi:hypothetical protein